jgi:hypothetical protein
LLEFFMQGMKTSFITSSASKYEPFLKVNLSRDNIIPTIQ